MALRRIAIAFLTQNGVYRNADGTTDYGDLPYSGLQLYFPSFRNVNEVRDEYGAQVQRAIEALEQDGRTAQESLDFLQGYRDVMHDYALVIYSGRSVCTMLNGANVKSKENRKAYARDAINYDTAKGHWQTPASWAADYPYINDWNDVVVALLQHVSDVPNPQELIDVYPDMPQRDREWLTNLIEQQAAEAVYKGDVSSLDVVQREGAGHRIRIANTRQRQIQSVNCNVLAEPPVAEAFLSQPENQGCDYTTVGDGKFGLNLGAIEGTLDALAVGDGEEGDLEGQTLYSASDDFLRECIEQFVKSTTSTWDVRAFDGKWYAIRDAQGALHVIGCNPTIEPTVFVTYHKAGSDEPEPLLLNFVESGDGVYMLDSLCFVGEESGLKTELSLMSSTMVESMFSRAYVPISKSEFALTADNAGSIQIVCTDIANIDDIADTTGDGKGVTEQYVVKDVYDDEIDITEQVLNAADGSKYDIRVADIQRSTFNGHEQTPVLVHDGKTLVAGVDYEWEKTLSSDTFTDVGEHWVDLIGSGDYTGLLIAAPFFIDPADIAQVSVSGVEDKMHTGVAIAQAPVLTLGDYTLAEGKDYDVTYVNNVEVGTATVTFAGKGNFAGELSGAFQIKAAATPGQPEDNAPTQPSDGKVTPA